MDRVPPDKTSESRSERFPDPSPVTDPRQKRFAENPSGSFGRCGVEDCRHNSPLLLRSCHWQEWHRVDSRLLHRIPQRTAASCALRKFIGSFVAGSHEPGLAQEWGCMCRSKFARAGIELSGFSGAIDGAEDARAPSCATGQSAPRCPYWCSRGWSTWRCRSACTLALSCCHSRPFSR